MSKMDYLMAIVKEVIEKYSWEVVLIAAGLAFLCFLLGLFTLAGFWGMFSKAGEKGWKILIPFYNMYLITRLAEQKGAMFLLFFVPVANLVFWVICMVKITKRFGKPTPFAIGLILFPPVFSLLLGFGKAECANPKIVEEEDYYYYYKPEF